MNTIASTRPPRLLTEDRARRAPIGSRPRDHLVNAVHAALVQQLNQLAPDDLDASSAMVHRAATSPATTGVQGVAVAGQALADFVSTLGPVSAASQLIENSLNLSFGNASSIRLPGMVNAAAGAFVAEGAPIPVVNLALAGPTMTPFKIAVIVVLTTETVERTAAPDVVRTALVEATALTLDNAIFSTAAAVAGERPAGLLNGAITVTATAAGDVESQIIVADLVNLASAVAPVAGSRIAIVASPKQAVKLQILTPAGFPYPIYSSAALADRTVAAVALPALAFGVGAPDFDTSREAVLHMDDDPDPVSTTGTPNVSSAPTRSLYQTDCVGIRLIATVSWAKRASGAVAVATGVNW